MQGQPPGSGTDVAVLRHPVSIGFAATLLVALFGFILLLAYARPWLSMPVGAHGTIYLYVLVGLIIGIWLLTCAYLLVTHRASSGEDER